MLKKIAVVQLGDYHKTYDFFMTAEQAKEIEIGDKVVTDTARGLVLGTVVNKKAKSVYANKFIVQKVDMTAHNERIANEQRLAELQELMKKREKEVGEIDRYIRLAKSDEEMARLVNEYLKLTTGKGLF